MHTLLLYTCENTMYAHSLMTTVTRNIMISGRKIRVFNSLNEKIGYDTLSNNPCACLLYPDLMSLSFKVWTNIQGMCENEAFANFCGENWDAK